MASAEREPIPGGMGAEPQRGPGEGVRAAKPPEAEKKLNFDNTITRLILQ